MLTGLVSLAALGTAAKAVSNFFWNSPEGVLGEILSLSAKLHRACASSVGGEPAPDHFPEKYKRELLINLRELPECYLERLSEDLSEIQSSLHSLKSTDSSDNLLCLALRKKCKYLVPLLLTPHCPYLSNGCLSLSLRVVREDHFARLLADALAKKLMAGKTVLIEDGFWKNRVLDEICESSTKSDLKDALLSSAEQLFYLFFSAVARAKSMRQGAWAPRCKNEALAQFLASRCTTGNSEDQCIEKVADAAERLFELLVTHPRRAGLPPPVRPNSLSLKRGGKTGLVTGELPVTPKGQKGSFDF